MQQTEPIQLSPIIEPTPVEFSMDTIGWKFLFVLLIIIALYFIYKYYLHYKNNRYRREAITRIQLINSNNEITIVELITQIMFQVKQSALFTFGRKKVASLKGESWFTFLDKSAKGSNFSFYGAVITDAVYKEKILKNSNFNKEEFIKMSINWIKNHAR